MKAPNYFFGDVKHALRLYRRTPSTTLSAVMILGVALAFVCAFVSLYMDIRFQSHPGFENGHKLATVSISTGTEFRGMQYDTISELAREISSIEALSGVVRHANEFGANRVHVATELVTREYFGGLSPKLALGRGFEPAEHSPDGDLVVVLSYDFWQEQFNGDPGVLGSNIELHAIQNPLSDLNASEEEAAPFRVIGVMGSQLKGTFGPVDLWMPFERAFPLYYGSGGTVTTSMQLHGLARLSTGVSVAAARTELNDRFSEQLSGGLRYDAIAGVVQDFEVQREASHQLKILLLASILLAVVAACDVSLFLLARAPARRRELGIRMAVGAPLRRIAQQLIHEASVLVICSAILGIALSAWLSKSLPNLSFFRQAEWTSVSLYDWQVLLFLGIFLLVITFIVSLAPIGAINQRGIVASSNSLSARASVYQSVAGTVQLAIAGLLASAAIAFAWYLNSLIFGFSDYETDNLHIATFDFPMMFEGSNGGGDPINLRIDRSRQGEAILAIPGVTAVAFGSAAPSLGSGFPLSVPNPVNTSEQFEFRWMVTDHEYVDLLDLNIKYGRGLAVDDTDAALVNEALAYEYFGTQNPVGELLPMAAGGTRNVRVVGVLEDVSFEHPAALVGPIAYTTPYAGVGYRLAIIESQLSTANLQQELQGKILTGELEVVLSDVVQLSQAHNELVAEDRARGALAITAGILVVALSGLGLYSTQHFLVSAGMREYAIRSALGAGPRALRRLVFSRSVILASLGIALGTLLSFGTVAWMSDSLIPAKIPTGLVSILVLVTLSALVLGASLQPARLARQTQPGPLLRED